MTRQQMSTDRAPAALGAYSQAIVAGGFVFCSGTAGIDPATGTIPSGIEAQTEQALLNLSAVLTAAGASLADLVRRRSSTPTPRCLKPFVFVTAPSGNEHCGRCNSIAR
jgi:enamine deaminase RidA (YjgF/YER057c/UK114 family)